MAREEFHRLRTEILVPVQGDVLELGIGTGLNLPHYSKAVTILHAVDPALLLPKTVAARRARLAFPLHIQRGTAEELPYGDRLFDYVVSTWTLCTIPDPVLALQEVGRVLKPGGHFLFLEHGRSDDQKIAVWQDRLNPIQNLIACGCNLNRQIDRLITQAGLNITRLDRFAMETVPRLGGEMYRGAATKKG
ncbi:MAG: class I SAM-dependent methyltransferase [Nitrospira sp.]|nr:class I SAM-dependent methyltransferase [Nitrospira sp.]